MMKRRTSSTVGTADTASAALTATTTVISTPRSNSAKSACKRLAVQLQLGEPHRGIGQLNAAHHEELMASPADDLAQGYRHGPGQGVRTGADRRPGEGMRETRGTPADAAPYAMAIAATVNTLR